MFIVLGIQHTMSMGHIVVCGLSGSTVFFYNIYRISMVGLSKNVFENGVDVFISSTIIFAKNFSF